MGRGGRPWLRPFRRGLLRPSTRGQGRAPSARPHPPIPIPIPIPIASRPVRHRCGFSKRLEPTVKQLGRRFDSVDSVAIAKMDGSRNEVPGLDVDSFPMLVLVTASGKRVAVGDEVERTVDGLASFIRAHAEVPFELPVAKDEL